MLAKHRLGDHLAAVQHQVFEHLVLESGERDRLLVHLDPLARGIENHGTAAQ